MSAAVDTTPYALARYSPAGLAVLGQGPRYRVEPHIELLSNELADLAVTVGGRLIVSMPPRHGKSMLCSQYFPAWYLGRFPDRRILWTSYEASFAADWGRKARDVLLEWGPAVYGVRVAPGSSARAMWNVEAYRGGKWRNLGGGMATAGVGGGLTGKGSHIFGIDDPIKNAEQARSKLQRDKTRDFYRAAVYTRLEADPEGAIALIMTRWHEDDLAGWLVSEALAAEGEDADSWRVLDLPAIAGPDDALGRQPGEALSKRYPIKRLARIKRALGTYWFNALYQQRPAPDSGTIFKVAWASYALAPAQPARKDSPLPAAPTKFDFVVQVWDTAYKEGELNDYSACVTVGYVKATDTAYVLDVYRDKLEMPALIRAIKAQFQRWGADLVLVEDKGSGTSAVQTLRKETMLKGKIQAQPVRGDKVYRAHLVTPQMEAGNVVFCQFPALGAFESELYTFPLGQHDDMVDAFVYALMRVFNASYRAPKSHRAA